MIAKPSSTEPLKEALRGEMEALCRHLFPEGQRQGADWCIGNLAGEPGRSLRIALSGPRQGCAYDFATGEGVGNPLELWMQARNCSFAQACKEAEAWLGRPLTEALEETLQRKTTRENRTKAQSAAASALAARKRKRWPEFQPGTEADLEELAKLRRLPVEGLRLARSLNLLHFGQWKGIRAWFLRSGDGKRAQARRMDGKCWPQIGHVKAWSLPGSEGGLLGEELLNEEPAPVLLTEGGPDFLAACVLCWRDRHFEQPEGWVPLALLGATHRLAPAQVAKLAGRRVRIFVHADEEGEAAADRWMAQLRLGNCEPEAVFCRDMGAEDLNAAISRQVMASLRLHPRS